MFESEKSVFEKWLPEWLQSRLDGSYAVIKGLTVLGTRDSFDAAMRLGIQETRGRDFFVRRIQPDTTIEWMSHIAAPDAATPLNHAG